MKSNYNAYYMRTAIVCLLALLSNTKVFAQAAVYTTEVFGASIPYNTTLPDKRTNTTDWIQKSQSGFVGTPNDFQWTNAGANPAAANQNIAGFPAGAGFVRYINRNTVYGSGTAGVNYAASGDAAILATRSLDFSGRTIYNAFADTFCLDVFRDGTAGAVASVLDYIEVYVNTQPNLTGATLLNDKANGLNKIYRSATQAPITTAGWKRYHYVMPNLADYVSATGGKSNVYIIIAAHSAGGNNIYLDNFNMPQWPTPMQITCATLNYQANYTAGKSTNNNLLLGVKITTKGSTAPLKLDGATFSTAGSTNFINDAQNLAAYYTGGSNYFSTLTSNGVVNMPSNAYSIPGAPGLSGFGWYNGACPATTTPATMTLNPGDENYIWLACDMRPTALTGNYVGGDFQFAVAGPAAICTYFGNCVSSINLVANPIPPQTFGNSLVIGQFYSPPYYSIGNGGVGYTNNDYISAVNLVGDNGTEINNYDHDGNPATYCPGCLAAAANPSHCRRLACGTSYDNFLPTTGVDNPPYQKRFVQLTVGYGIRGAGPSYILKAQAGENPTGNNIAVFIDWNNDGDFSDTYNGGGGVISENLGTHTMLNGDLNNYPITAWPGNTSWVINVPDVTDVVTNVAGSGGPIYLGNVRMRVREVFGISAIDPFNGYTYGEAEDYTILVTSNCPSSTGSYCKWIGNTSDWNSPSNWCPSIPTATKDALIPLVGNTFYYPKITNGVNAVCRNLKIQDNGSGLGAQLNIDAPATGSLTVTDSILIGNNAPATGSSASFNVNSNYNPTITIPGKSTQPPAGTALQPQTPFRTYAQTKTQVAYTASELVTTYGWKAGDIIEKISIEVASITGGSLSASQWPYFRIQAYLTATPVTFHFPALPNVKAAVMPGDANVVTGPITIYNANPLALNMGNATGGTKANGNYMTMTLAQNAFIYDGVSNLVLSFESWTQAGAAPLRNYVLYDETSPSFTALSLNYNAVVPLATGPTGYNLVGNSSYYNGVSNTTLAGITAVVSNQRPRLDFTIKRIYQTFPISLGGSWINNNSTSNGFNAGNSKVTFNGANNTSVNGYETTFNNVVLNKTTNSTKLTLNANVEIDSSLMLTNGKLLLKHHTLSINNADATAIIKVSGGIVSETIAPPYGVVNWNMGTNTDQHVFPFANSSNINIPFAYKQSNNSNSGYVSMATYKTGVSNLPYPAGVTNVNDVNGVNNQNYNVDRFWIFSRTGTSGTAKLKFSYANTEAPAPIAIGSVLVNRFDSPNNIWQNFQTLTQTNTTGVPVSSITINNMPDIYLNTGAAWALSDATSPLRLSSVSTPVAEVYPNPFSDFIKVVSDENENTEINYVVYDATMRSVADGKLITGQQFINTQNLAPGTYIIQLNMGNTMQQKKIVKM